MVRVSILLLLLVSLTAVPGAQSRPGQQPPQGRGARQPATRQVGGPGQPRPEWWQREETKTEIGLRKDQASKIEDVYQALIPRLRSSAEDRLKAEDQLSKLFSSNTATEDDVVRQLNQVQAARNEVDRQRTLMLFRINRLLTPEQRTKLRAYYDRMDRERRESGRRGDPPKPPPVKK
jgi:Spy/CpxP family protein refolding chaperone